MKVKRAATDFTADALPATRPAVFWDCWRVRHRLLFALGGILLLFLLPLLISHLSRDVLCASVAVSDAGDEAARAAAVANLRFWFRLIDIPCWLIFSVGLAGTVRVVRQLVFGEGVFLREDFFTGVRQNGGAYAGVGLFTSLWLLLTEYAGTLRGSTGGLAYLPIISGILLLLPIGLLLLAEVAVYRATVGGLLKNAMILYFRTVPTTLAATAALLLPLLVCFVLDIAGAMLFVKYVFLVAYAVLLLPSTVMGEFLYCAYVFDKHINRKYHPEEVDKGIHRREQSK